jgi:RND family efflux transporter MFP subunit
MTRRGATVGAIVLCAVVAAAYLTRSFWMPGGAAPEGARTRSVSVLTATAELKPVPVDVDAIGTVATIQSVAIKSRIETMIDSVNFEDGAKVTAGDILFKLDARQIDAQISQAEGVVTKDEAQLAGAQRDFARYSDLIVKGATPQLNVDNAKTAVDTASGTLLADKAMLENLKVQKSYTVIRAPISGRISAAAVKAGNFVRPSDNGAIATINQMAPVYVVFAVPQRFLAELRDGMTAGTTKVIAMMPGDDSKKAEAGKVAMVENTVDATTGMVTVRGVMDNTSERLWPGTIVTTKLVIRDENAVTVPSVAVQRSQGGDFVYLVKDGKAVTQSVTVGRTSEGRSVIAKGLSGGETVVTDGQLLLSNGTPVEIRARKAGA